MKILWLNAGLLLPLDKGGKLRTWHVMRHLAARHDITYLSFADPAQTDGERDGMREVCTRLRDDSPHRSGQGHLAVLRSMPRDTWSTVSRTRWRSTARPPIRRELEQLLDQRSFDAVVCDFLPPVVNLPERLPCPSILFTHNVEAEIWRRHAENARGPVARALLGQQWHRMLRFEREALSRFDLVLAVSEADGQTFERLYPGALRRLSTSCRPASTRHTLRLSPASTPKPDTTGHVRSAEADTRHLVFTGSMDWLPNEDGMHVLRPRHPPADPRRPSRTSR